ncbi:MAG: hypothetical protein ACYDH9_00505 [Limisphaerales bacterium]
MLIPKKKIERLDAQTGAATNHVLELDGTNSFVELPPNIFTNLTQAMFIVEFPTA